MDVDVQSTASGKSGICMPCPGPCGCIPIKPPDEVWVCRYECLWKKTYCKNDYEEVCSDAGDECPCKPTCAWQKVWVCTFKKCCYKVPATVCNPRRRPFIDCDCAVPADQYFLKTSVCEYQYPGSECAVCPEMHWKHKWEPMPLPRDCAYVSENPCCTSQPCLPVVSPIPPPAPPPIFV